MGGDINTAVGAQSVVELARLQLQQGKLDAATSTINGLIDGGTNQSYWLAHAYITLADILTRQGKKGEAREYLESLKENYPGTEADVKNAIASRLSQLGSKNSPSTSGKKDKNSGNAKNSKK